MTQTATKSQTEIIVSSETPPAFSNPFPSDANSNLAIARISQVWGQRRFISQCAGVGLLLSLAAAFLIPKRFESVARLMPPDQSNSGTAMLAALTGGLGGGKGTTLSGLAGDLLGLKSSGDLFIGVLQSRTVEDELIHHFDLQKLYRDRHIEDARKDLEAKTSISADRKSGIISIQVTDRDPQRAAAMAQDYIDQLDRVVVQLNTSSAHREREFLEQRLVQVHTDLETAERKFSEFASKNTAIDIPAQGKAMIEAAAALEGQLIGTQTELESLRQIYTENNVRVRAAQARVDELRRQIQKIGGTSAGTTQANSSDQSIPSIRELPVLGVPYADLYRTTKVQEAIFETLTEEYELAKVQEVKETPSVKVLDSPDVPDKKSFPPRVLIVLLGTVLSASLAVAWISGKSAWEATDSRDPAKVLIQDVGNTFRHQLRRVAIRRKTLD